MVYISFCFMLMMLIYQVCVCVCVCVYYKENTEACVVTSKEIGLEVNAEKPMRKPSTWSCLETRIEDKITT